jgi:hypothetical protein
MAIRYELDDVHRRVVVTVEGPFAPEDFLASLSGGAPTIPEDRVLGCALEPDDELAIKTASRQTEPAGSGPLA